MRCFVGVDFSMDVKSCIADMQMKLKKSAVSGRWKHINNYHLTLKFLNEIDSGTVEKVNQSLEEVCSIAGYFTLRISELGNFPGKGCLRVLWLSLDGDLEKLYQLQESIDTSFQKIGFEKEKRGYTPHVTLGQDVVFGQDFDKIKKITPVEAFPDITVDKVYLFKSEQIQNKRIYTPIREFKLLP